MYTCKHAKSLRSCPTLCDTMGHSPPGSSVPGILQARTLEWVTVPSSRGSTRPRDRTRVSYISCTGRQVLYHHHHLGMWPQALTWTINPLATKEVSPGSGPSFPSPPAAPHPTLAVGGWPAPAALLGAEGWLLSRIRQEGFVVWEWAERTGTAAGSPGRGQLQRHRGGGEVSRARPLQVREM